MSVPHNHARLHSSVTERDGGDAAGRFRVKGEKTDDGKEGREGGGKGTISPLLILGLSLFVQRLAAAAAQAMHAVLLLLLLPSHSCVRPESVRLRRLSVRLSFLSAAASAPAAAIAALCIQKRSIKINGKLQRAPLQGAPRAATPRGPGFLRFPPPRPTALSYCQTLDGDWSDR